MDIVCFGARAWQEVPSALDHLLPLLAAHGHRVLYIEPAGTDWGQYVTTPRVQGAQVDGADELLRPLQPRFALYRTPTDCSGAARGAEVSALLDRSGFRQPLVLAGSAAALDEAPRVLDNALLIVYALLQPVLQPHSEKERALIARSTLLLCAHEAQQQRLKQFHDRVVLVAPAVDFERFSAERIAAGVSHPELQSVRSKRAGFFGPLTAQVDYELLEKIAERKPEWQLLLVGRDEVPIPTTLLERSNVQHMAAQPSARLAQLFKDVDVFLVPYQQGASVEQDLSYALHQVLGAGRPIVSTAVNGLGPVVALVATATTDEEYLVKLEQAYATEVSRQQQEYAEANSWSRRGAEVEQLLERAYNEARETSPAELLPPTTPESAAPRLPQPGTYIGEPPSAKLRALFALCATAGKLYWRLRGSPSADRPEQIRKILIARDGRLGDTIAFLPALRALRARFPKAHITLIANAKIPGIELVEEDRLVDELRVVNFFATSGWIGILKGCLSLLAEGYDIQIAGPSFMMVKEGFFAGAPLRIGIDDGNPYAQFNNRRVPLNTAVHEAENSLALIEALGAKIENPARRPSLASTAEGDTSEPRAAESLLARLGIDPQCELIALHAGAANATRQWPAERFAALARALLLREPQRRIVLTGIKAELPLIETVHSMIAEALRNRVHIAAGQTNLDEFKLLLDNVRLFVCNDTGSLHVARARGIPLLALLGPENHRRWGPHPQGLAPAVALRHQIPCAPCLKTKCDELYCLRLLQAEEAAAACERMLSRSEVQTRQRLKADGPGNFPLELVLSKDGWSAIAQQFEVFSVTVVLVGDREQGVSAALHEALATVAAQDYPRFDLVLVNITVDATLRPQITAFEEAGHRVTVVSAGKAELIDNLKAVIDTIQGDYVLLMTPDSRLSDEKVSQDVAALFRNRKAHAAMSYPEWSNATSAVSLSNWSSATVPLVGGVTLRREYLQRMLAEGRSELPLNGEHPVVCPETLTIL